MSAGWHCSTSQIFSKVEKRIALALPVFRIERLEIVIPTFSASSDNDILRFANITSRLTMMGMIKQLKKFHLATQYLFDK